MDGATWLKRWCSVCGKCSSTPVYFIVNRQTPSISLNFHFNWKEKVFPLSGKMLKEFEIFYHSHVIWLNIWCCPWTSCYCTFCRQTSQFSFCDITDSFSPQSMKDILTSSPHNRWQISSCPEQLNMWPCLLCSTPLTIRVFATLQSDPRDLWPLRYLIIVMRKHDLTNILTIFENFEFFDNFYNFDNIWQLLTISTILDNFDNLLTILKMLTIFDNIDNFDNFDNFGKFWQFLTIFDHFWQLRQFLTILKRQSWKLVTFETLITAQAIENLNSWQSLVPVN